MLLLLGKPSSPPTLILADHADLASLKGFQSDLGVDDTGFAVIISILFVGFVLFQVPSNMIMVSITNGSRCVWPRQLI